MPKNIMGTTLSTTYHGSSNHKIFGTAGELIQYVENVAVSSSMGMTPSTITGYGYSYITSSGTMPTSGVGVVYLAAPRNIGVEKTVILNTTAAGGTVDICLSTGTSDAAGAGLLGTTDESSTGVRYIAFSTLATDHQSVTLIGLTTSLWAVKSCSYIDSTDAPMGWGAAGGIRPTTAARTT